MKGFNMKVLVSVGVNAVDREDAISQCTEICKKIGEVIKDNPHSITKGDVRTIEEMESDSLSNLLRR